MEENFINESNDIKELCDYVSDRITQLRLNKNISEYQMSLDLGQNRSYIQSISSKRSLPSLSAFFKICAYFEITPIEFFGTDLEEHEAYTKAKNEISKLSVDDVELLRLLMKRFQTTDEQID